MGTAWRVFLLTAVPYALIVDLDGDGNLAEEARLPLVSRKLIGMETLAATITGDAPGLPTIVAFRVAEGKPIPPPFHFYQTVRRGTLPVGERTIAFALAGNGGSYDAPEHQLYLDHDGDGRLALDDEAMDAEYSPERYRVADERLNIGSQSYRFAVAANGDTLTLTPLESWMSERPVLATGTPAPAFRFVDIDLVAGSLEEYRGRVVLVYFWWAGCAPCSKVTPHLVELHRKLHEQGFEILAVNSMDPVEVIREYVGQSGLPGRLVADGRDGEIAQLFRVVGAPVWFLVDRDGMIAGHRTTPEELAVHVERLVRAGVSAANPAP
jgi:peroxiredoxin